MKTYLIFFLVTMCSLMLSAGNSDQDAFDINYQPEVITLQPVTQFADFTLSVRGPDNLKYEYRFDGQETPFLDVYDLDGNLLPDGLYKFELRANPVVAQYRSRQDFAKRGMDDAAAPDLVSATTTGNFMIKDGEIMDPHRTEPGFTASKDFNRNNSSVVTDADPGRDVVHADDVIVDGSLCVGFDCVNGEVFGSDTIRLKENNLRIHFEDTSIAAGFATNDWRIIANSNANGGGSFMAINDVDAGRNVVVAEAGARSNALYVDNSGNVGFGTSTPVAELHAVSGDSATLRLEQNGSSGFAPQTWDIAGNETNFFVRDVSGGSTLPFRIQPDSPTNTLYVGNSGVGFGKTGPTVPLDVNGDALISGDGADLSITDTTAATGSRRLLTLTNNGTVNLRLSNTGVGGENWDFQNKTSGFLISESTSGVEEMLVEPGGDVTIGGNLTELSSRHAKENLEPVDAQDVLDRVMNLPITSWNYKHDQPSERHMGVMAQDFYTAFGLGSDECRISTMDTAGVALASIQAVVKQKDAEIAALNKRLERLEALVLEK